MEETWGSTGGENFPDGGRRVVFWGGDLEYEESTAKVGMEIMGMIFGPGSDPCMEPKWEESCVPIPSSSRPYITVLTRDGARIVDLEVSENLELHEGQYLFNVDQSRMERAMRFLKACLGDERCK